jgi:dTDP-4-dehydrorhamnose 3,5-epimerase-like enzyme
MQIHETSLPGVKLIELKAFSDDRGYFFFFFLNKPFEVHGRLI